MNDLRGDDIIDSRDVIKRIEELEEERQDLQDALDTAQEELDETELSEEATEEDQDGAKETLDAAKEALGDWDNSDEAEELRDLKALAEECESSPDWSYGETLIKDEYFREYAEQLADDIGAIDSNAGWPLNCIDWDEAADQLQQDYFQVDFGSDTYWIRS